ncbi:Ig-like domain-containing protein [Nocardia sp. NBC_01388]|uniref:phage tail tube protein n=1 Tax=Nocardia sp. NBC_01388 TaxID=2903596 RepID=UPI0032553D9C
MTATTLTALKAAKTSLLLKPLDAAVFLAPWPTAAPTAFTDTSSALQPLPVAFQSVGFIDKKTGIAFARNITDDPIESYGELEPTRDDVTSDITTIEFEPQETRLATLQLTNNANLAAVLANGASGEYFFAQPLYPQIQYYSCIIIGKDGNDAAPIYVYKVMPKVAVTKYGGEQWTPTTTLSQKLTLTAFKDDAAGYAVGHGFAGTGWKNLLVAAGIPYTVTGINVTPATASLVHSPAGTQQLVVTDQLGGTLTTGVTYVSSVTATATVSGSGLVTAVAAGSTVVTASFTPAGGSPLTATCTVTVT